jgi:hypothetical protein
MAGIEDISVRPSDNPRYYRKTNTRTKPPEMMRELRGKDVVRLLLLGKTVRETAELLGCTRHQIYWHLKTEEVREELYKQNAVIWAKIEEDIGKQGSTLHERIIDMSDRALSRIEELIESDNEHVALKASVSILDRNIETSTHHKVDSTNRTFVIDANMLQLAAQSALEIEETIAQP